MALFSTLLFACSDSEDDRATQDAQIVAVKVNGQLYMPTVNGAEATVVLAPGINLTNPRLEVLASNGTVTNLVNGERVDCRKPLAVVIEGQNGQRSEWTLKVQSPPQLTSFFVEGLQIDKKDIHFGAKSLIVQVPKGTNLSALKVSMEFTNGAIKDFTNGTALDYSAPRSFSILGVDELTTYSYSFIITTETVGPAFVKSMTINGIATDSVVVVDAAKNIVVPYVKGLTNFSNANIAVTAGFGNVVDPAAALNGLNLLTGTNKVKITGTDGIQKEFTIAVPKLSLLPLFSKTHAEMGFGGDGGTSIAFSGNNVVLANHNTANAATLPVGPNYYDFTGTRVNILSKTGSNIDGGAVTGVRKLASDDEGVVLGVQLGAGAGASTTLTIWKWNSVSENPTAYITYTQASLGLAYAPRAAGINISGSLSKDAVITVPIAQKQDVLVWTVTGGVLNPTPTKYTFPFASMGYYFSIQPMPVGVTGFVGLGTGVNFNGIISLTSTLSEQHKQTGIITTDGKVITHNGRTYLAYTAFVANSGARFRVCDITDGQAASYASPIMDALMPSTSANGNNTVDADLRVIDGKLHAAFICTNIGVRLYKLEN